MCNIRICASRWCGSVVHLSHMHSISDQGGQSIALSDVEQGSGAIHAIHNLTRPVLLARTIDVIEKSLGLAIHSEIHPARYSPTNRRQALLSTQTLEREQIMNQLAGRGTVKRESVQPAKAARPANNAQIFTPDPMPRPLGTI